MVDYDADILDEIINDLHEQIKDEELYPAFYHPDKKNLWYMKFNWGILYWIVLATGIALALIYDFYPLQALKTSVFYKILRHIAPFWSYFELCKYNVLTEIQQDLLDILLSVHVCAMLMAIFIYLFGSRFKMYAEANSIISFFSYIMILASVISCIITVIFILLLMMRGGNNRD